MAKLIINPTSGARKEIPVGDKVLSVGRDPSNDLVLSDSMVSRRHAILERREDHYVIRDNGSSNGTMVNGDKLTGDQELRDGDLIAIGSARLLFQSEPGVTNSTVAPIPAAPDAVEAAPSVPGEASECPSCGLEAGLGDQFCRRCGKDLPARSGNQVACANCNASVQLPAEFCGSCGKPLPPPPARHNVPTEPGPWVPTGHEEKKPTPPGPPSVPKPGGLSPPRLTKDPPSPERPRAPRPSKGKESPAGFWIRLAAYLIDGFILNLPMLIAVGIIVPLLFKNVESGAEPSPLLLLLLSLGGPAMILFAIGYLIFFWTRRGATPGKMLFGLRIETAGGESPLRIGTAFMRLVGYFINSFTFGIGFLLIAFSEDKRGLHDRLADTRVVKRQ